MAHEHRGPPPYKVGDADLYALLAVARQPSPIGCWATNNNEVAGAVLTLLVRSAVSLPPRALKCGDRRLASAPGMACLEVVKQLLADARFQALAAELDGLYKNTQAWLQATAQSAVVLVRGIHDRTDHRGPDLATLIARRAAAAKALKLDILEVELDTLSSWWQNGCGVYAGSTVSLTCTFPAADVAWVDHRIGAPKDDTGSLGPERGEWVVINKATDGRIRIDPAAVKELTVEGQEATQEWLRKQTESGLRQFLAERFASSDEHCFWAVRGQDKPAPSPSGSYGVEVPGRKARTWLANVLKLMGLVR